MDVEASILWGRISMTRGEDKRRSPYLGSPKVVPSVHLPGTFLVKKGRLCTALHGESTLVDRRPREITVMWR